LTVIFETVLSFKGERVNERGYGTAFADSGSGLVLRLSDSKRNNLRIPAIEQRAGEEISLR
jgi:hypothetical protein